MKPDLSIVLPCSSEERNLRVLLPALHRALSGVGMTYEIIVVDANVSGDQTQDVCVENNAHYVTQGDVAGYGEAVRAGIRSAQGEYIAFMDGDGTHPPEALLALWQFKDGYDVVAASRYAPGGSTEVGWKMRMLSRMLNRIYIATLKLPLEDVSTSLKLYRAALLKTLPLKAAHFDIVEEMLCKVIRNHPGARIKEVPIAQKDRIYGESKRKYARFACAYALTLIRLRWQRR